MTRRNNNIRHYIGAVVLGLAVAAGGFCAREVYKSTTGYSPMQDCIDRNNIGPGTPLAVREQIYRNCKNMYR